jgi:hypothetical protein
MEDGTTLSLNKRGIISPPSSYPFHTIFSPTIFAAEFAVARALRCRPERIQGAVGIYCRDMSTECDGFTDDSGFLWFANEIDLTYFLSRHLFAFFGSTISRQKSDPQSLVEKYRQKEIDRSACATELNQMLHGMARVLWWGEFAELECGHAAPDSFVSRVRCSFHGSGDAPIHLKARFRFHRFIRNYRDEPP